MKILAGIITIALIFGLLVVPGVFAADDNSSTDPDLSNNQASVTVDPYSVSEPSVKTKTIPLQPTGVPIGGMLLATLMIFAGIGLSKRK